MIRKLAVAAAAAFAMTGFAMLAQPAAAAMPQPSVAAAAAAQGQSPIETVQYRRDDRRWRDHRRYRRPPPRRVRCYTVRQRVFVPGVGRVWRPVRVCR